MYFAPNIQAFYVISSNFKSGWDLGPYFVMVDRNLSGYNLTGPISPSFVQLTNLTSL
jgi:hypothetical protein